MEAKDHEEEEGESKTTKTKTKLRQQGEENESENDRDWHPENDSDWQLDGDEGDDAGLQPQQQGDSLPPRCLLPRVCAVFCVAFSEFCWACLGKYVTSARR